MKQQDCFLLGEIQKTFGYKGELWFYLDVDNPLEYRALDSVFVERNGQLIPYFLKVVNIKNKLAHVKLEDVDDEETAKSLLKSKLYLPLEILPDLGEYDFYLHEIEGYTLIDKQKGVLGIVNQIYNLPHNDLIGMDYQGKEVLIPIQDELIISIDKAKKELHIELPEGLLEVYLEG